MSSVLRIAQVVVAVLLSAGLLSCMHLDRNMFSAADRNDPVHPSYIAMTDYLENVYGPGRLFKMRGGRQHYPKYPDKAWEWFVRRRQDRSGRVPLTYREKATAYSKKNCLPIFGKSNAAVWSYVGPITLGNVLPNGRIVELAVHPQNEQIIYAATASGGVFKTTDQGLNWVNLTDHKLPTLGCGSIAIDAASPETVLVGLGEGTCYSAVSDKLEPLGTGIYKSTDGGQTWALLPGTGDGIMRFVVDIAYGTNSNVIFAAATGGFRDQNNKEMGAGFWRSDNGGNSWTKLWDLPTFDINIDPTDRSRMVVSTREFKISGQQGYYEAGIRYSTDGGVTFTPATTGDLTNGARIELARQPGTPATMLALVGSTDSKLMAILKSANGGQTWAQTARGGIPTDSNAYPPPPGQMTYNNCIEIASNGTAYFGSNLRAFRSADGGENWTFMTEWMIGNQEGIPYIHADHHDIAFGATANTLYMATDGGFFLSLDGGTTWQERNNGLDCTQIYRVANHPVNENALIMGTQDNCKFLRKPDGTWRHWPNEFGDCMEVDIVRGDPESDGYLGMNYNGSLIRFATSGDQSPWYHLRGYEQTNNGIPDNEQGGWVSPILFDPQHPERLWVALTDVYRLPFDPQTPTNWEKMIDLVNENVSVDTFEYMDFSSGSSNRQIYLVIARYTAQGWLTGIIRADIGDGLGAVSNVTALNLPRNGYVGAIKCDPTNNDTLWLTYTDFGFADATGARARIYKSTNKGDAWTDMTGNYPQDLPATALFLDPQSTATVIVGSDLGCYRSDDGGATYYEWNSGLPNTVISDFAYFAPTRKLRAGTYGRGFWEVSLDAATGAPDVQVEPNVLIFEQATVGGDSPAPAAPVAPAKRTAPVISATAVVPDSGPRPLAVETILNEDFEGAFPGTRWQVWHDPQTFDTTWGTDSTYIRHGGAKSVWCAAGGTIAYDPVTDYCPDLLDSYMAFGPFSLADATAGQTTLWYWLDAIQDVDTARVLISLDAQLTQVGGYAATGNSGGWTEFTVDFSNVDTLGNILGQPQVWVIIEFYAGFDLLGVNREGLWVDDVLIQKTTGGAALPAPTGVVASDDQPDRVRVTWNAVAGATEYQVWRNTGADTPGAATALSGWIAGLTYDDMTAQQGTTYYYYVKARNATATSALSAGDAGSLATGPTLPAPTGVAATNDKASRVAVSWNAVAQATEYQVWRNAGADTPGAATALSGWIAGLTYDDTTAQLGTNYFYYVKARNATLTSALSAGAAGSIVFTTIPPQILTVRNVGNGPLMITPPTGYPVQIGAGQSAQFQVRVRGVGLARGAYTDRLLIANNTTANNPYSGGVTVEFYVGVPARTATGSTWRRYR